MNELEKFLAEKQENHIFPGRILFAKVWGSRSHHCEIESSDWDFSGVYAAPIHDFLGLTATPQVIDGKKPDHSFYEVKHFCNLLLKGNPGILEMLYTERMCQESSEWLELKGHRRNFLSTMAVKAYLGYANEQLRHLLKSEGEGGLHTKGGKFNEKWAYHLVRVVGDALRIVQGGEPMVWKEGEEHDFLMKIRNEEYNWQFIADYVSERMAIIEGSKPWKLPETGDRKVLENWLIDIRLRELHGYQVCGSQAC